MDWFLVGRGGTVPSWRRNTHRRRGGCVGVAHLADQPVQGGNVALEIGVRPAAVEAPVDPDELRGIASKSRDIGHGRTDSGRASPPFDRFYLPLEGRPGLWLGPLHARPYVGLVTAFPA
jgi:hypothetical protein